MVDLEQQIYDSKFPKSTWDKALTQTLVYMEQGRKKNVSIQVAQGLIFPHLHGRNKFNNYPCMWIKHLQNEIKSQSSEMCLKIKS
jgi:hypothetical protein